jgi:nucleoside-diphosphate-sugar epimerase
MRDEAGRAGVDLRVLRPSIVVGAGGETPGTHPSQTFFTIVRIAAALALRRGGGAPLRLPVRPEAKCNMIAVEDVALATTILADKPEAAWGTFHVVVGDPPTYDQIRAVVSERLGARGLRLVDPRSGELSTPTPLESAMIKRLAPYRHYLDDDVTFDDGAATVLNGCVAPARLDAPALHRLIGVALAGPAVRLTS